MAKAQEPNPIEKAIGDRAREVFKPEKPPLGQAESIPLSNSHPSEIAEEPNPTEMLALEDLNRETEERLQDQYPEGEIPTTIATPKSPSIPVLKSDPPPETKTCSPESPPQKGKTIWLDGGVDDAKKLEEISAPTGDVGITIGNNGSLAEAKELPPLNTENKLLAQQDEHQKHVDAYNKTAEKIDREFHPVSKPIPEIDKLPPDFKAKHAYGVGVAGCVPVEDIELTALKKYIFEEGFVVATVAYHIVALCAQPMVTPSTTTWDFVDRAMIPDMVFALLKQPGYLEGIWPSLKIVMSSNKGNAAWCAGIATTIAFFDVIRTLPTLKEMNNEQE